MSEFPELFRVKQRFDPQRVDDVAEAVRRQLASLELSETIQPGQTVAITAGSRGVANIGTIIKAAVDFVRSINAEPIIVPAMGSHGGGTADGQLAVLRSLGVTEEACGAPIRASMETVVVCETPEGVPVHFDRHAFEANHVLVCNRVKPHTGFTGEFESGLLKMMLIGLGKHAGATVYHRAFMDFSFDQIVRSVAAQVIEQCRIVAGLAVVENGYEQTAVVEAIRPDDFIAAEKRLLAEAKRLLPRLPFEEIDVLVIDQIGKNISGTGMDTNVVGRKQSDHKPAETGVRIKRIVVRGLTDESAGNATGIGLAEFCTRRAVEQIDQQKTNINCITGLHPTAAMIPMSFDTDRETIAAALDTIGLTAPANARLQWIRNTLDLVEVECSAAFYDEAITRDDLQIVAEPRAMQFDSAGKLIDFSE